MEQMLDKGIYGAFMHVGAGIDSSETPYFSEGWWKAIEATVKHTHKIGFLACLYDEDKWPSGVLGEVPSVALRDGGEVRAGNPKAIQRRRTRAGSRTLS
jgi:hypothetical protein